jgi:mRNA interferase MazF
MARYVPKKGDFVTASFDPQFGHEQKGRTPALIVSNDLFNKATGFAFACPIANTDRKVPFHVQVPDKSKLTGFIMVDQVKSIDYRSRKAKFIEKAPSELIKKVLGILNACWN